MRKPIDTLWLVLPAIAEMVDEQGIEQAVALAKLEEMLGEAASDPAVRGALNRLHAADDELTFRELLGAECLRALNGET